MLLNRRRGAAAHAPAAQDSANNVRSQPAGSRLGALAQGAAALLWIAQAALLATPFAALRHFFTRMPSLRPFRLGLARYQEDMALFAR